MGVFERVEDNRAREGGGYSHFFEGGQRCDETGTGRRTEVRCWRLPGGVRVCRVCVLLPGVVGGARWCGRACVRAHLCVCVGVSMAAVHVYARLCLCVGLRFVALECAAAA